MHLVFRNILDGEIVRFLASFLKSGLLINVALPPKNKNKKETEIQKLRTDIQNLLRMAEFLELLPTGTFLFL